MVYNCVHLQISQNLPCSGLLRPRKVLNRAVIRFECFLLLVYMRFLSWKFASSSIVGKSSHWYSEAGILDLFLAVSAHPHDISFAYNHLTYVNSCAHRLCMSVDIWCSLKMRKLYFRTYRGMPAMPQMFAIAYHQCRQARTFSVLCFSLCNACKNTKRCKRLKRSSYPNRECTTFSFA